MRRAVLALALVAGGAAAACDLIAGLGSPPDIAPAPVEASADAPAASDTAAPDGSVNFAVPDAAAPDGSVSFAAPDAAAPFASCFDVQRRVSGADSGVYVVLFGDAGLPVFCDMSLDNGGWTAFFVGRVGKDNVFAHFEDPPSPDDCPDPASQCLRRLPDTVPTGSEFAVTCGGSAIRFTIDGTTFSYFQGYKGNSETTWPALIDPITIAGDASVNLAHAIGIGKGWVVSNGSVLQPSAVFASSYSPNTAYDYCNGVPYVDAGLNAPVAELLYR